MQRELSLQVSRVTQDLRRQALRAPPGTFLGSTFDLAEQFHVSRPTFRQAAKVLEREHVVFLKTGVGGGLFSRQPDTAAVAHMTDIYLQSQSATVGQILAVFGTLYIHVVRTAATRHSDETSLSKLREFLQDDLEASLADRLDWNNHLAIQTTLIEILADLSGNPLLKLFFTVTREMLSPYFSEQFIPPHSDEIATAHTTRIKLVEEILAGEPEFAAAWAQRFMVLAEKWLHADLARRHCDDLAIHELAHRAVD